MSTYQHDILGGAAKFIRILVLLPDYLQQPVATRWLDSLVSEDLQSGYRQGVVAQLGVEVGLGRRSREGQRVATADANAHRVVGKQSLDGSGVMPGETWGKRTRPNRRTHQILGLRRKRTGSAARQPCREDDPTLGRQNSCDL